MFWHAYSVAVRCLSKKQLERWVSNRIAIIHSLKLRKVGKRSANTQRDAMPGSEGLATWRSSIREPGGRINASGSASLPGTAPVCRSVACSSPLKSVIVGAS